MSNTVHVEPVADLIEHEDSDECVCGPTVEPVPRIDGSMGWLIIHHSLDGRETRETASVPRPWWRRVPWTVYAIIAALAGFWACVVGAGIRAVTGR